MKIKSLLSFFVPAALMALVVASCSDYDNGYNEQAIKFQEEFRKAYGDIDPEQDWNLSERATVTVSTMKESEVKIYVLRGGEYSLVGDYQGVKGTRVLGFDMLEGTKSILVSDGVTAEQTVPGGVVTFSGTRTTHYGNDGTIVNVSKIQKDYTEDGVTYHRYLEKTEEDYDKLIQFVPEGEANLNKVTHDFTYVSTGAFIIYPFHWVTSSNNTIGVYYFDENGTYHEKDVYTIKASNDGEESEILYEEETRTSVYSEDYHSSFGWEATPSHEPNDWHISTGDDISKFHMNGWSGEDEPSGITVPYIQYFGNLPNGVTLYKDIYYTFTPGQEYWVEIAVRQVYTGNAETALSGVSFFANDASVDLDDSSVGTSDVYNNGKNHWSIRYGNMDGTKKVHVYCKADDQGKIRVGFNLDNPTGNWLAFKGLSVQEVNRRWASTDGKGSFGKHTKSQGIKVDIQKGTKFGMYLKKTDTLEKGSKSYQFFSESRLNDPNKVGNGVRVNADGSKTQIEDPNDPDYYPCHTSTFYVDDKMYIGFEDWPNDKWAWGVQQSDFDLNDVVLAFDGCKPIIINEDPEPASWLLVCEDLGGSFDTDYNDVVFKVEHVSGRPTATVTAMAAGGTLASYIFFRDPDPNHSGSAEDQCIGEIHQLLGASPKPSGSYTPINAYSRYQATGRPVTIDVPEDWTMAYYSTDTWQDTESGKKYSGYNMGGFQIRVLKKGKEVSTLNPNPNDGSIFGDASIVPVPDKGDAPYILCLPYTYIEEDDPEPNYYTEYTWAWPQELCTICIVDGQTDAYYHAQGQYPKFAGWVSNHADTNYQDWYIFKYKNHDSNMTVETMKFVHANTNINEDQSHLFVVYNTLNAEEGEPMNLRDYITTSSTENITYKLYYKNNASDQNWNYAGWGLFTSRNDPDFGVDFKGSGSLTVGYNDGAWIQFANTNPIKIEVSQDGETKEFFINVTKARTEPNFLNMYWQWQGTSAGGWDGQYESNFNDQDMRGKLLYSGEKFLIKVVHNGYSGGGTFTATVAGNGTGSNVALSKSDQNAHEFIVTAGNASGKSSTGFTVTVQFSGDATYKGQSCTYQFKYATREYNVRFTTNGFALAIDDNNDLVLQTPNNNNNNQKWDVLNAGGEYYNLYNVGKQKYLTIDKSNYWNYILVDGCPGPGSDVGKFRFVSKNGGFVIVNRRIESGNTPPDDRYFGGTLSNGAKINTRVYESNAFIVTKSSF